jgi:hypothetical protein
MSTPEQSGTSDPTLMMFNAPAVDRGAEQAIAMAPAPETNEQGFDRLAGAASRIGGKVSAINQRREMKKVFEENYMLGEQGIDKYEGPARAHTIQQLVNSGVPQEDAERMALVAIPSKEQFRDPQTGNVDIARYWQEAPGKLVEFENSIKEKGMPFLRRDLAPALKEIADQSTSLMDYNNRVAASDIFGTALAADTEQAALMRDEMGRGFETQQELSEAEEERATKERVAAARGTESDIGVLLKSIGITSDQEQRVNESQRVLTTMGAQGLTRESVEGDISRLTAELEALETATYPMWGNIKAGFKTDKQINDAKKEELTDDINDLKVSLASINFLESEIQAGGDIALGTAQITESASGTRTSKGGLGTVEASGDILTGVTERVAGDERNTPATPTPSAPVKTRGEYISIMTSYVNDGGLSRDEAKLKLMSEYPESKVLFN